MKLFKKKRIRRTVKLIRGALSLGSLCVGGIAVVCLAVMGLILAFFWNKRTAALPKALRILRHFI